MEFKTTAKSIDKLEAKIALLFSFSDKSTLQEKNADSLTGGMISQAKESKDFKADKGASQLFYPAGAPKRLLLVGLGKSTELTPETFREAVGQSVQVLKKLPYNEVAIPVPALPGIKTGAAARLLAETITLASYEFSEYKSEKNNSTKLTTILLVVPKKDLVRAQKEAAAGQIIGNSVSLARDLGNHPANTATPSHLAGHALALQKQNKALKVQILNKAEIKKEKMGALLAVSQGSEEKPKFIVLEYRKKKSAPLIVLVGKGVTFDSGGLSIKPSERMEEMKNDMAGAAAVLGIMKAAGELNLPLNLVGLIPATENLPSGKSLKPGDIIKSRGGKTIEVINTDAEGRLILSDALDYAKKYKPDLVVDFATLTGAMVVALGFELIGSFSTGKKLTSRLEKASLASGEKIWPMPLEEDYRQLLKSETADLRNVSATPFGGAITAALFLQNFVDYPWIHLDIAGPAWPAQAKSWRPKGSSGVGVRLFIDFLLNYKK